MAKKAKKDKPTSPASASRAEQLRSAVEAAFGATAQGAAPVQKRAQDLADELVGVATRLREAIGGDELNRLRETLGAGSAEPAAAAARVREAVDGLRPPSTDQLEALRAQVEALEARVAQLEAAAATDPPAPARRRVPARKPAGAAAKAPPPGPGAPASKAPARGTAAAKVPGAGRRKPAGGQGT
jgi:polyhydroxyalkanoate synthesis regulator phasin